MEQIYQDRDQFAKLVREVASPDVGRMGIEILSFTIKVCFTLIWIEFLFYFAFIFVFTTISLSNPFQLSG